MSANENGDSQSRDPASVSIWPGEAAAVPVEPHFDTFETHFFQQGDDSTGLPGAGDVFDDIDARRRGRPLVARSTLAGLTVASTALAVVACWALERSNTAEPLPPAPVHVAKAAAVSAPVPVAAPAPAVVPSEATAIPAGPQDDPGKAAVAEAPAPQAEPAATAPVAAAAEKADQAGPIPAEGDAQQRCRDAIRSGRGRAILGACPAAFAESTDAETAVALAKAELDRGHFSQAYSWSQKAIAINPASADAYVFAGGAEQNQGRGKAAKEAYLHYLRLAPSGRYAAEIRSIVRSL